MARNQVQRQRQKQRQTQVKRRGKRLAIARSTALDDYMDADAQDNETASEPGIRLIADVQQDIEDAQRELEPPEEEEQLLEGETSPEDALGPASEYGDQAPEFEAEPDEPAQMPGPWGLEEQEVPNAFQELPLPAIKVREVKGRLWAAATPPHLKGLTSTGSRPLDHLASARLANPNEAWENLQALGEFLVGQFPQFFLSRDRKEATLTLRPLTQEEVARRLRGGVSAATVSRMARHFIDTPYMGIIPLKLFFQAPKAPAGKRVTKYQLLEKIKAFCTLTEQPPSAGRIAAFLATEDIHLSRSYISRLLREHKHDLIRPKDKPDPGR